MPQNVIQWFPGHMAQTRRVIRESLPTVDVVFELCDARIPNSSRNPLLKELLEGKPSILVLNKSDLADPDASARFCEMSRKNGETPVLLNCKTGKGVAELKEAAKKLLADKFKRLREKGVHKPVRAMVVGIPNVGKSTLINCLAGAKKAEAENRPGVTRQKKWVKADADLELLDMPGVLWQKFDDEQTARNLAATGAIKDSILPTVEIAYFLSILLAERYPALLSQRYKLTKEEIACDPYDRFLLIGKKRGLLQSGGEVNEDRLAAMLLDEFRSGAIGRITLDEV